MEIIEKTCTTLNSCEKCSSFNLTQFIIEEESLQIYDNCTKFYNFSFEPITKVYFDENAKIFNQTRCCQGNRTLLYNKDVTTLRDILDFSTFSTKDASVNNGTLLLDSRSSKSLTISLLTMALVGMIVLCVLIVVFSRCKRRSKVEQVPTNLGYFTANGTHSDEVAEYSTVEESAVLVEVLTQHRTPPKVNEAPSDNYFILEPDRGLSNTTEDKLTIELKECETGENVYNTLHENDRRSKEMDENAYSHFVDFNDSVFTV